MNKTTAFIAFWLTFALGILSACGGSSSKESTEAYSEEEDIECENSECLTIVPVIQEKNDCERTPLQCVIELWYSPQFAFKDKNGRFLRFDNDENYSSLCKFPLLVKGFIKDDMTNNHMNLKRASVMKELCDSFNIPVKSTIIGNWYELEKFDSDEIRSALKNYYNYKIEDAFNAISNDLTLYLNGKIEKIDPDVLIEIERFIYDNHHPENAMVSIIESRYNLQGYEIDVDRYWRTTAVFPAIDKTFVTLTGDTIPKGSLIMGYGDW